MGPPLLGRHLLELQSASGLAIAVAAAGSFVGQIAAAMQSAPLWMYVVAALAPWLPILILELIWTYRHYRWLSIFLPAHRDSEPLPARARDAHDPDPHPEYRAG